MNLLTLAVLLGVSVWSLAGPFLKPASRDAKQGMARYERGDYVGAAEKLEEARALNPSPVADFNLGVASYRGQNVKTAAESFQAAAMSPELPPGDAAYNLGNTLAQAEQLEGALEAYRQALRLNPQNDDARTNYELISKLMQSQEGQDQQQQEPGEDGEESENQDGQDGGAPPDSSQQSQQQQGDPDSEQEQEQEQQQPAPSDSSQAEPDSSRAPQGDPGQEQASEGEPRDPDQLLTPEEAKRLLDQLTPAERDLIQQRLRGTPRKKAEKDW